MLVRVVCVLLCPDDLASGANSGHVGRDLESRRVVILNSSLKDLPTYSSRRDGDGGVVENYLSDIGNGKGLEGVRGVNK
jgi:hypothetical protein